MLEGNLGEIIEGFGVDEMKKETLAWDYQTFKTISEASKVNRVSLRRDVMRLAELLGVEFEGFRRELKKRG